MPRRRPGALRATRHSPVRRVPRWADAYGPLDRLSPATCAAVRVLELAGGADPHIAPGRTALLLAAYRAFTRRPGGVLLVVPSAMPSCPGCAYDDVTVVRDGLQAVYLALPSRPRAEFGRLLAGLDAVFRRRTLPEPAVGLPVAAWTDPGGSPAPWWRRRRYADA